MEKVKPCPFCGKDGVLIIPKDIKVYDNPKYQHQVICAYSFCPMGNEKTFIEEDKDKAIKAWNTRS